MSLDVGFDAQVPSLPDAGAATSSLGETFSSDLSTGTADFSIPIDTPNGPNDIGPHLTLHYDSSTGNGPFGLGFSLRLPRILLSLNYGVPRYDSKDPLVLEGAGELLALGHVRLRIGGALLRQVGALLIRLRLSGHGGRLRRRGIDFCARLRCELQELLARRAAFIAMLLEADEIPLCVDGELREIDGCALQIVERPDRDGVVVVSPEVEAVLDLDDLLVDLHNHRRLGRIDAQSLGSRLTLDHGRQVLDDFGGLGGWGLERGNVVQWADTRSRHGGRAARHGDHRLVDVQRPLQVIVALVAVAEEGVAPIQRQRRPFQPDVSDLVRRQGDRHRVAQHGDGVRLCGRQVLLQLVQALGAAQCGVLGIGVEVGREIAPALDPEMDRLVRMRVPRQCERTFWSRAKERISVAMLEEQRVAVSEFSCELLKEFLGRRSTGCRLRCPLRGVGCRENAECTAGRVAAQGYDASGEQFLRPRRQPGQLRRDVGQC